MILSKSVLVLIAFILLSLSYAAFFQFNLSSPSYWFSHGVDVRSREQARLLLTRLLRGLFYFILINSRTHTVHTHYVCRKRSRRSECERNLLRQPTPVSVLCDHRRCSDQNRRSTDRLFICGAKICKREVFLIQTISKTD